MNKIAFCGWIGETFYLRFLLRFLPGEYKLIKSIGKKPLEIFVVGDFR